MADLQALLAPVGYRLMIVVALVLLDTLGGIALAVKARTFEWKKVADFLEKHALKIVGWLIFEALALFPTDIQFLLKLTMGFAYGSWVLLVVSTGASALTKAQTLQEDK